MTWGDRRLLTLLTCCFSLFMAQLDATIVNVGLPSIQRSLGSGIAGAQWVVDAYVLALGSLAISSGAAGDRFGRKRVFGVGLVVFSVASAGCSVAPTVGVLVAFRLLQGVGASMLMPSTLAIIADVFPDARERAAAIGVWAGVSGLSMVAGPLLGGVLVDAAGWRSLFWVNLPVGALALAMSARYVPESRAPKPRALDLAGQALLVVALAALAFALIEGPDWGWASPRTLSLFGSATAAVIAFVAVELRVKEPMLDPRLFARPSLVGATVFALLAYAAAIGFLFLNTLYLQRARGFSPLHAGLAVLPLTVAVAVTAPLSGRLTGNRGGRAMIAAAGLLIAAGMAVLTRTTITTPYGVLLIAYLSIGIAWGAINPPITALAISALPRARSGMASAIAGSARQIGALLGVALMGSLTAAGSAGAPHDPAPVPHAALAAATHVGYTVAGAAGIAVAVLAIAIPTPRAGRAGEEAESSDAELVAAPGRPSQPGHQPAPAR
jgi:EmrB/QacA subfamily drug resistance transporter